MDKSALVPLAKVGAYSQTEVGEKILQLAKLQQKGLPIAQTTIILSSTLEDIVNSGNLVPSLRKIINSTPKDKDNQQILFKKLQKAVMQTELPKKLVKEILNWYDHNPGFVRVTTSDLDSRSSHQNVMGSTNLIESILSIWAEQIQLDFDNHQLKLFAQPIVIQHQGQPESSGIAFTKAPGHKSQIKIDSVWGVFDEDYREIEPDQFEVDVRTGQLTQQHLYPQQLQLQRKTDQFREKNVLHYKQDQLSLHKKQVLELAHFVITIKRLFLKEHLINWFFQDNNFYISSITPDIKPIVDSKMGNVILTGDAIQSGIITGPVFQLNHKEQIKNITQGQIVIVHQLGPEHLSVLSKAAAIICDQGLSSPLLSRHISNHSLPTIINTKYATSYLRNGLSIIVNANTGQVLAVKKGSTPQRQLTKETKTKTYISAGNPHQADQYVTANVDGIGVLRSEYTFASLGEHPKYLLKSRRRHQLKTALQKTIQAYRRTKKNLPLIYRTLDLTSQEFKALAFANSFEPDEPNPYLGYRGGIRTLNNLELLSLEVEVLEEVASFNNIPLGLMIPFIRTPSELSLIQNYLAKKHHFSPGSKIGLYLQLNTPENILQLDHYLRFPLTGVSFNVKSIHALLHGIDPDNPDIFALYPYDIELMKKLLVRVREAITDKNKQLQDNQPLIKLMLHLESNNLNLVEIATSLGFDIITVKPEFALMTKQRIQEIEEQQHAHH